MEVDYFNKLQQYVKRGRIPQNLESLLSNFFLSYTEAATENGWDLSEIKSILSQYLDCIVRQLDDPYTFELFHKRITQPLDYYQLGLDLFRPLIVFSKSTVQGIENLHLIQEQLKKNENVILFANHQTEPDPQVISLLIEKTHPQLAKEMIFVAGHRVINDPLAVPLSKGRNLLCIFSKNYIENPPELKQEKRLHNQRTMKRMSQLLAEGGKCIFVAPSGGRDRPNSEGKVDVARFDPQSIEMFWLMAQHSGHPTHFYPLALLTYDLLPPPNSIKKELGERRHAHCAPVHLAFGKEIDMENYPGSDLEDKKEKRAVRAEAIWKQVCQDYETLLKISK